MVKWILGASGRETYPLELLGVVFLPRRFEDGFLLFAQVGELLDAGLVQAVDYGVLALRDEDSLDLR
jgi:hypothetical protein